MTHVDEELRLRLPIEPKLPHVVHDADDLPWTGNASDIHHASDGILVVKFAAYEGAIDHEHARRAGIVALAKSTSRHEVDAHHRQIIAADDARVRRIRRRRPRRFGRAPQSSRRISERHERQLVGVRRSLHAPLRAQPRDDLFGECLDARGGITIRRQSDLKRHHVRRVVAGIHARELHEAAHQQSAGHEQHRRHRDFRHDERAARTIRAPQVDA